MRMGVVVLMAERLLWTRKKTAEQLEMSLSHFQRHVQPYLPCVYLGQLRMYRPCDVERWLEAQAGSAEGWRSRPNRKERMGRPARKAVIA
jgi:hypothetical protein